MFTVERAGGWAVVSWEPDEASTEDVVMALTEEAYARSKAIGMGAMHFREGPLPEETREEILAGYRKAGSVTLDYVHGRCCKFGLFEDFASRRTRRVRIAEDHWSRDHPGVSIEDLCAGAKVRLAGEHEAESDRPQDIEAMLEQAIVTVAKGGESALDKLRDA